VRRVDCYGAVPGLILVGLVAAVTSCGGEAPVSTPTAPPATTTTAEWGEGPTGEAAYIKEIEDWRARRLERLTSDSGWLTVVGLHWLKQGENRFGSGAENEVVLPEGESPLMAGSFFLEGEQVSVQGAEDAELMLDGKPVTARTDITSDDQGKPDMLRMGDLSLYVIKRGERYAVRVKNPHSAARKEFEGLDYFPISTELRVEARFVPSDEPKTINIPTVLGTTAPMDVPGVVTFSLEGREFTLEPVVDGPDYEDLFFIFKDQTSADETYPAGRFLYTDAPVDGRVTLDFNKAYNPPCAFTEFATCPLPPKQNVIAVRIEAGEKDYGRH
jgi:uncharacterized protein (DUF1684 family)